MRLLLPLIAVLALVLIAYAGVSGAGMNYLFGVFIPYAAFLIFLIGFIRRVVQWGRSPVPFRIPATCGQEKSFPWVKRNRFDNPFTTGEVIVRMLLEVFLFRSLFRNTKVDLREGPVLRYSSAKWLWLGALAFHYSFLTILVRHLRFFTEPIPFFVKWAETLDGILQVGVPTLYQTDIVILAALAYLFLRRVFVPQLRYISLANDYFPLFLILAIAVSGILMRYFFKTNIVGVKELTMGLVTFSPKIPEGISVIFYIHLFLVSILFAYFPFSKLMHMGGVFLSPTRNLANNNRAVRHINPWNYPVKVHTYEEYEDEFREKMKEAGLPVEKE
ncbi:MAG: sulfate reduction electron transfer complex DsrMKJOP subunit DsrM [Thermodesulfobacteriota bacterium]